MGVAKALLLPVDGVGGVFVRECEESERVADFSGEDGSESGKGKAVRVAETGGILVPNANPCLEGGANPETAGIPLLLRCGGRSLRRAKSLSDLDVILSTLRPARILVVPNVSTFVGRVE
jgi:hypothetical protein